MARPRRKIPAAIRNSLIELLKRGMNLPEAAKVVDVPVTTLRDHARRDAELAEAMKARPPRPALALLKEPTNFDIRAALKNTMPLCLNSLIEEATNGRGLARIAAVKALLAWTLEDEAPPDFEYELAESKPSDAVLSINGA